MGYETELIRICLDVENQLISDRMVILKTCKTLLDSLFENPAIIQKQVTAELAYDQAHLALTDYIEANKWQSIDQDEYEKNFHILEKDLEHAKAEFKLADAIVQERLARKNRIDQLINLLTKQEELLTCFDEALWNVTVDEVLIKPSGELIFSLKSGQQIIRSLKRK